MTRSDLKATTASVELDNSHQGEKLIVGHGPLAEFLTENSFPTSKSTIAKYCSPAINTGPPIHAYWGRLPTFKPTLVLAWARARLRPPNEVRSRPAAPAGDSAATTGAR